MGSIANSVAAVGLWAALAVAPALAQAPPAWLSCPDAAELDLRPDPDRDPARVRELAPKAGAQTAPELWVHARHADRAYALYAAVDAGQTAATAFSADGLGAVAFIYGDPGPNGERGLKNDRTRTIYGFVADEAATGRRYIVFRGTQQPAEWVRNVQAGQRPYPPGAGRLTASARVHAGFLSIFESLELEGAVAGDFADNLPALVAGREVVFVGHSLGSALATLAGVEAARRAPQASGRLRVVTLASPRVGNSGFAAMAKAVARIDRVCNLVDPVTAVPPSTRTTTYVHVGAAHRVSSFDWPVLANDLAKPGDQVLCWHGHEAYGLMLDPAKAKPGLGQCFKADK